MPSRVPQLRDARGRARVAAISVLAGVAALLLGVLGARGQNAAPPAAAAEAPPAASLDAPAAAPAGAPAVPGPAAPDLAEADAPRSQALGLPHAGALLQGVELPREGPTFFTWDPFRKTSPNPRWRRYGTDRLVETVLIVLEEFAAAHPDAPRVGVGDLSRPKGGPFYPTHRSHQNGLDADVYFPRLDGEERPADDASGIDRKLAQDLVDRFVAAGAEFVFVGPRTGLKGPPKIVQVLEHHDRHLHVRIPNETGDGAR